MAEKYHLKVLIDLHGAPGAQNAADHSGSGRPGLPTWLDDSAKQEQTIRVLERLAIRYATRPTVWGIELVNEPLADTYGFRLISFYRRAYRRLLKVARPGLTVVFSDGFKPLLLTGALWRRRKLPIAMDCHFYQCFSMADTQLSLREHLKKARQRRWLIRFLQLWQPVLVGEWSGMLPWSLLKTMKVKDRQAATTQYIAQQEAGHQPAVATFYWNYKTEGESIWNLNHMLK